MPTERFYRLPKEKKDIIRQAAVEEFARVPYDKVSINQIIQKADISRGSFYTYFEDKQDVLRYIFEEIKHDMKEYVQKRLLDSHGDFWYTMESVLDYFLKNCDKHHLIDIARNVRMFSEAGQVLMFEEHECEEKHNSLELWLFGNMDKTGMKFASAEDFHCILEMCMWNLMAAVGDIFKSSGNVEYIKKIFYKKLEILRYGVCQ